MLTNTVTIDSARTNHLEKMKKKWIRIIKQVNNPETICVALSCGWCLFILLLLWLIFKSMPYGN